jgi:hypothetical protein
VLVQVEWIVWPLTLAWTQWIEQDAGAWQVNREWVVEWPEECPREWPEECPEECPREWPEEWPAEWPEEWQVVEWLAEWVAWDKACHLPEQVQWTTIAPPQCQPTWARLDNQVWPLNRVE